MQGNRQFSFFELLTIIDTALQIADFRMNTEQSSNDDIMRELQRQNSVYLEEISNKEKEILNILTDIKSELAEKG